MTLPEGAILSRVVALHAGSIPSESPPDAPERPSRPVSPPARRMLAEAAEIVKLSRRLQRRRCRRTATSELKAQTRGVVRTKEGLLVNERPTTSFETWPYTRPARSNPASAQLDPTIATTPRRPKTAT